MASGRLPAEVEEFARYLRALTRRLAAGTGWYGVFALRDPEGLRACLDGSEVPPWDVVQSLLQDLSTQRGADAAQEAAARASTLYRASVAAHDTGPGSREALEPAWAACSASSGTPPFANATSRRRYPPPRARPTANASARSWPGPTMTGVARRPASKNSTPASPPSRPAPPGPRPRGPGPPPPWPRRRAPSQPRPPRRRGPGRRAPSWVLWARVRRRLSSPSCRAWGPRGLGRVGRGSPGPEAGVRRRRQPASPAPPLAESGTEVPATPRGARFAGAYDGEGGGKRRKRDKAADDGQRLAREAAERAAARRAAQEAVARLGRLRAAGRSGEAHVVLCEAAAWPAPRLPVLAEELERAGLGADVSTLLWEMACLPPTRLAAAAEALVTADRTADGERLLRQSVSRPAPEVAHTAQALLAAGAPRGAAFLLEALVRARTPEEAARAAAEDPATLVPLLLDAAAGVSSSSHHDLAHALRMAALPGVPGPA